MSLGALGGGKYLDLDVAAAGNTEVIRAKMRTMESLRLDDNIEDHVTVPGRLNGDFVLRVKGESMIDAGILDGDLLVVQRAQDARNGDIVVALAGDDESADEATVKRFFR